MMQVGALSFVPDHKKLVIVSLDKLVKDLEVFYLH